MIFIPSLINYLFQVSIAVQEKIDALNERLERECYGSGERSLPPGDFPDYSDYSKNPLKPKSKFFLLILFYILI